MRLRSESRMTILRGFKAAAHIILDSEQSSCYEQLGQDLQKSTGARSTADRQNENQATDRASERLLSL